MTRRITYGGNARIDEAHFYSGGEVTILEDGVARTVEFTEPYTVYVNEKGVNLEFH